MAETEQPVPAAKEVEMLHEISRLETISKPTKPALHKAIIPTSITVFNMLAGYFSVIYAMGGKFSAAAFIILGAIFLDFIDGQVAKAMGATSKFGAELDSLSDTISFGMAPSMLMYRVYFVSWSFWGIVICLFPLLFGAFRLARFNSQSSSSGLGYFVGLPIPASAALLSSFVILTDGLWGDSSLSYFAAGLILIASFMMISTIKYEKYHFSHQPFLFRGWRRVLIAPILIVIIILGIFYHIGCFLVAVAYCSFGPARRIYLYIKKLFHNNP
jgi:CDP-diacylglycerol--serine O-phosphatidyltransferase